MFLFVCNVPVNNFSVMSGCFPGLNKVLDSEDIFVPYSKTQHITESDLGHKFSTQPTVVVMLHIVCFVILGPS